MQTDLQADLEALAATLRASTVAVRTLRGDGSGSGVVCSSDGTIVTNAHVAQTPAVEVELADGRRLRGAVDRRDERRDLARIRIDARNLEAAAFRDPGELRVGELVAAFGHPMGVSNVLSTGIVYAAHHLNQDRFVRADVRLAPGNSGGALADSQGRVVGINSMIAGGLALAIPADDVRRFLGEAIPGRRLGVRLARVIAGGRPGYVILAVEPGSAAAESGLIPGDVLLVAQITRLAAACSLPILRGGREIVVAIVREQSEVNAAA